VIGVSMGRLCVILVRRDPRTTVVAMHIEHRNRQSSVTQLLQNNVGSVLYFDAFAESTLCVSWTADADVLRDTKKDFICLDDLYMVTIFFVFFFFFRPFKH
jgi:hypothetical protein